MAAAPAASGAAYESPSPVHVAASPALLAPGICTPGANSVSPGPYFDSTASSVGDVDPTTTASRTRCGLYAATSGYPPAEITYTNPAAIDRRIASSSAVSFVCQRTGLMLTTAGFSPCAVTQSTARTAAS